MRYYEIIEALNQKPTSESGTIKPQPPLSPAQARQRAAKKSGISKRMGDEQRRHGDKMAELRTKMSDT